MSETEFENESTVAVAELPPEKPEKAARKTTRKPKTDKAAASAVVEDALAADVIADVIDDEPEKAPAVAGVAPWGGRVVDVENDAVAEPLAATAPQQQNRRSDQTLAAETLDIRILKEMKLPDLTKVAKEHGIENATGMRKQDLIFSVLQVQTEKSGLIFSEGVLECRPDCFVFRRPPEYNYLPGP